MFRNLPVFTQSEKSLQAIAARMVQPPEDDKPEGEVDADENPQLPAGYTYLGQFIDHDITFDPVSSLERQNDPDALVNFRTPKLDLDSMYGRGPADQPYLYDSDGVRFLLGEFVDDLGSEFAGPDLPRNSKGRALIGDPRNDENLIISQLQSMMLRFHNRIVAKVRDETTLGDDDLFKETQRRVRWHYQWVVVHDFLRRIVGDEVVEDILRPAIYHAGGAQGNTVKIPRPQLLFYRTGCQSFIPVEFSGAAYRFGHSMVRPGYNINEFVREKRRAADPKHFRVPIFSASAGEFDNLNGFRPLPSKWGIQWKFFFETTPDFQPQRAYKIDSQLVNPLGALPASVVAAPNSLPERNLLRGLRFGLPSGQTVTRAMGIQPLSDFELAIDDLGTDLAGNSPLWYYILKEAELRSDSVKLGPVGGRIVAEVLIGLLVADPLSYLNVEPSWTPDATLEVDGKFGMPELINAALAVP